MDTNRTLPRWAQWAAGLALLATALTAAGLSLAMNLAAGLGVGLAVAIAFGLSDVAKVLMPVVANGVGWNGYRRGVYVTASIVSVVCACLFLADQFGERIAAREDATAVTQSTERHVSDLRASLASAREMAATEAQRGGCGPRCLELTQRAEKLETALTEAVRQRQGMKPAEAADGKAVIVAGMVGSDPAQTSRGLALVLIVAALLIGELCSHLAGPAAQLIGSAMRKPEISGKPVAKAAQTVAKIKADAVANAAKPGTAAYYLARLRRDHAELANQVARGELSVYRASIAAGLRKEPKAKRKWDANDFVKPIATAEA